MRGVYNIEINNAFELVTLLLIVHVWPSSFHESNRRPPLPLSLFYFFHFSLSILPSFLPRKDDFQLTFLFTLPSLPLPTFSSLFTALQILVIRRERIECAFRMISRPSRDSLLFLLPPRREIDPSIFNRLTSVCSRSTIICRSP